jgi:hypothetical protein
MENKNKSGTSLLSYLRGVVFESEDSNTYPRQTIDRSKMRNDGKRKNEEEEKEN